MASRTRVHATSDRDNLSLGGFGIAALLLLFGLTWTSTHLAAAFTDQPAPSRDPIRLVLSVFTGRTS